MNRKMNIGLMVISFIFLLTGCGISDEKENGSNEPSILIKNNTLYNYVDGYSMILDSNYELHTEMDAIRTRLTNATTTIDIYYDNFKGTIDDKDTYMNYSNKFTEDTENHTVLQNEYQKINGNTVHLLKWKRDILSHVKNDKPYYFTAEIAKNNFEIYTISIKSESEIKNEKELIRSFKFLKHQANAKEMKFMKKEKSWNNETEEYYLNTFVHSDKLQWGLFDASRFDNLKQTKALEKKLDYTFPVLLRYQMIGEHDFPTEEFEAAYKDNRTIELTMQYSGENNITYEILNGAHDDYIHRYAKEIKKYGHPILFRLNNEMNGDWVKYSAFHSSKDTDLYIEVWRYIHSIFDEHGIDNMLWIWNPNHDSKPNYKWNHSLLYYPGDDYVDIIGLTAYNTGTYYEGENWTSFKKLYDDMYHQYAKWFDQPFMITEFSSSSVGGNKTKWIQDMFRDIKAYDRIKIAVWWSWQDLDSKENPARIYFLDENNDTIQTFKNGLESYKNNHAKDKRK